MRHRSLPAPRARLFAAGLACIGLLLLAGCLQAGVPGEGEGSGDGAGANAQALRFEAAVRLPGDRIGAEPNIATGPDGQVWVIAVGSVLADPAPNVARGAVNLWRSPDHGATWERQRDPGLQDKDGTFCSCDTDVELGPDGTLYITDFWVAPQTNGFVVEASFDGGATWEAGNFITQTAPAGNDRQYILAGRQAGELFLAYNAGGAPVPEAGLPVTVPGQGLQLWRSTDAGRTFVLLSQPFRPTAESGAFIAKPRVAEDGTLFYPWVEVGGDPWNGAATVVVATSRDGGRTFTRNVVADVPDGVGGLWPLEVDVGPDGVLHAVWMQRVPAGGGTLAYSRSADQGATWSPPRVVGWSDGTALLPWVAHAGPDRAVVAYYGTPDGMDPLAAPEGTRWDAWAVVVDGEGSGVPERVSPWPVKVGTFCPRGAACPEDRELLDYPAVAWRDGWVHVAFAVSNLDEGAGDPGGPTAGRSGSDGGAGHSTDAAVWAARAPLL